MSFATTVVAQTAENKRIISINQAQVTPISDSLFVLTHTITLTSITGEKLDTSKYYYSIADSSIHFTHKILPTDFPLTIEFKVFPFNLKKKQYNKIRQPIDPLPSNTQQFHDYYLSRNSTIRNDELLGLDDFQKSGSISRSISVGNSQNTSVISNMNLQIAGKISPDLELIASISDDNIPIQPDGNTQQLQDFDKVFIQLKHEKGQITAGDFEMLRPKSQFMNYHKKVQGVNASIDLALEEKSRLQVYGSVALSRGQYARNNIAGVEGNQGPYKLQGANFERTIIILSGTEQVFVDGNLLTRGQNYDYIIDYNSAEITFMPTFPITKDKRISVEFQYSDRNYARYLANAGFEFSTEKWSWATHYYIESDLKNQPLDQDLSPLQEQLLKDIGDSLWLAVSPSVDSISFNGDEVLYKRIDSLGYSPVYVHSISPDSAFYRLAFSLVGAGNGNYVQSQSSANGRVFEWVSPVNGIKQGDYEAVVLLVTPKTKQMVTTIGRVQLAKNTFLSTELAISNEDLNTFSPHNKTDNTAPALKLNLTNLIDLSKKEQPWQLNTSLNYEFVEANFTPIQRFRSVEFNRDWNAASAEGNDQQIIGANLLLQQKSRGKIGYLFQNFRAESSYEGFQNKFFTNLNYNQWRVNSAITLTQTEEQQSHSNYLKHFLNLEKQLGIIQIGISENAENNQIKKKNIDSLILSSFSFQELETYLQTVDTAKSSIRLHYKYREDYLPFPTQLVKAMQANEIGASFTLARTTTNRINFVANYRKLSIVDSNLTSQRAENTSMGRIEHSLMLDKIGIRAQSFYQLGSGMETSRDYSYIEVAAGQGVYSWIDYNGNEVKELNEFEIAVYQDQANFIRIYIPSSNFTKTYNNQFSTSININPGRIWRKSEKASLRFLSKFSDVLIYSSSLKTLNSDLMDFSNPFISNIEDEALNNLNSSFRNTLYYNRTDAIYSLDYTYQSNNNKVLMMNGFESKFRKEHQLNFRWNITKSVLLQLEEKVGKRQSRSEYFANREYDIFLYQSVLKINYQLNRTLRISLPISYGQKSNADLYGGEVSKMLKLQLILKYNMLNKGSLNASLQQAHIRYSGQQNGSVAFEMLEAMLPGINYNWNLSYQRNILTNMQLSITYNGRKSETSETIHVGSVQLRAYF